ncbi:hypothetical protein THASP1DRAFT_28525 [Thamnocephalis sphaerospora]|uniref:Uncharacterized protein n=1 Tax=Thamnocephalis sphaerospora TaxID=78915 RepID=A0A4P9XU35_9FUNG|nr:hypothetical protein THASP1DRAFT_28525 [Thamnocephalis sphaerospora]|eukprot:RKP09696.1 hypothetical protein THASP1DRAFT_28525 [Thamnocephalis sphaerospora]
MRTLFALTAWTLVAAAAGVAHVAAVPYEPIDTKVHHPTLEPAGVPRFGEQRMATHEKTSLPRTFQSPSPLATLQEPIPEPIVYDLLRVLIGPSRMTELRSQLQQALATLPAPTKDAPSEAQQPSSQQGDSILQLTTPQGSVDFQGSTTEVLTRLLALLLTAPTDAAAPHAAVADAPRHSHKEPHRTHRKRPPTHHDDAHVVAQSEPSHAPNLSMPPSPAVGGLVGMPPSRPDATATRSAPAEQTPAPASTSPASRPEADNTPVCSSIFSIFPSLFGCLFG